MSFNKNFSHDRKREKQLKFVTFNLRKLIVTLFTKFNVIFATDTEFIGNRNLIKNGKK